MSEPVGPHNIHEFLSAFADGELDAAQNLAVLDYLEQHREAFDYLRDRQLLRQSAQRVVLADQTANQMPAALKEKLNRLAVEPPEGPHVPPDAKANSPRRWPRGFGLIAAGILLGLLIGFGSRPKSTTPSANEKSGEASPQTLVQRAPTQQQIDLADSAIPVALVHSATHLHVDCSRLEERLHADGYPRDLGPLSQLVKQDLSLSESAPDLTAAGYHFVGAGPCAKPLEGTVHLLYKKNGPEPRAAISIFVQQYHGQFGMHAGRLYCVASSEATFPMCAWRSEKVVYFLIADDVSSNVAAQHAIPKVPTRSSV